MELEVSYPVLDNCYLGGKFNAFYMYLRSTGVFTILVELYENHGKSMSDLRKDIIETNRTLNEIILSHSSNATWNRAMNRIKLEPPMSYLQDITNFEEGSRLSESFKALAEVLHLNMAQNRWFSNKIFQDHIYRGLVEYSQNFLSTTKTEMDVETTPFDYIPMFLMQKHFMNVYQKLSTEIPGIRVDPMLDIDVDQRYFTQAKRPSKLFAMAPVEVDLSYSFRYHSEFINENLTWDSTVEARNSTEDGSGYRFWSRMNGFFTGEYFSSYLEHVPYDALIEKCYGILPITCLGFPVETIIDPSTINLTKITTQNSVDDLLEIA